MGCDESHDCLRTVTSTQLGVLINLSYFLELADLTDNNTSAGCDKIRPLEHFATSDEGQQMENCSQFLGTSRLVTCSLDEVIVVSIGTSCVEITGD